MLCDHSGWLKTIQWLQKSQNIYVSASRVICLKHGFFTPEAKHTFQFNLLDLRWLWRLQAFIILSFRSKLPFNQSIRMFLYKCFSPTYPCSISKLGRTVSNLKMDFWGHEAAIAIKLVTTKIVKNCSFCLEKSLIIIFSAEVHGQKVNAPPPP